MQLERKTAVRVVIDPQRSNQVQLLQRLGFKTKHHGILLERRLRDAVDPGGRADQ